MTRRILYQPPDGEGPSVVQEMPVMSCSGCKHQLERTQFSLSRCRLASYRMILPPETPSWCPIVSADMETWERWLKGHDA